MNDKKENIGTMGENLIANFIDSSYSSIFSFPNPKTKDNAQVTDVIIWLNRALFLIEVKTRDEDKGTTSIENWARSRIEEGVIQLTNGYNRIKRGDIINLNNKYYHIKLDITGISQIVGLIVLVYDGECVIYPSNYVSDIYQKDIPIHVISWNDLRQISHEIDTVMNFIWYLKDRFTYLENFEIPLDRELNALGLYKMNNNKFPLEAVDLVNVNHWNQYRISMSHRIRLRDEHNKHSIWIDKIESVFTDHRRLQDGIPLGLYFAWELGALDRRTRSVIGEKLDTVQEWFKSDVSSRQFSYQNNVTKNWLLIYFSKSDQRTQFNELEKLTRLKLIQLKHYKESQVVVYGFGFLVSKSCPTQFLGFANSWVFGPNAATDYTQSELEEALRLFGYYKVTKLEDYPSE